MLKNILENISHLDDDWLLILKKAWSIRLMILAGLLSGIEVALPFFIDDFPRGIAAGISLVITFAALVARIIVQKDV